MRVAAGWDADVDVCLYRGDALDLLRTMPAGCAQLVVTSPPYHLSKAYERGRRASFADYLDGQRRVIDECVRVLRPGGSICWQVGNHVTPGEIVPLDVVLYPLFKRHDDLVLRNRVVWHFEHGLHCTKRLSGRYEVLLWFTRGTEPRFHLDPIRVPQKYPGKRAWKGSAGRCHQPSAGQESRRRVDLPEREGEPRREDRAPCQFPIELVERVLREHRSRRLRADPYAGVGTTACAAVLHRAPRGGCGDVPQYVAIAREANRDGGGRHARDPAADAPVHRPDPARRSRGGTGHGRVRRATRPRASAQGMQISAHALSGAGDGLLADLRLEVVKPGGQ